MRHLWRGPGATIARGAPWILASLFGIVPATLTLCEGLSYPAAQIKSTAAEGDEAQARAVCSTCHAFPPPDILPRSAWRMEIVRMHYIRENRLPPVTPEAIARTALPPDLDQALAYFVARAPERLPAPEPWPPPSESPIRFSRAGLTVRGMPDNPAVSNVQLVDVDGDKRLDVLGTNMRQGVIFLGHPDRPGSELTTLASVPHPAHVTMTDVDRDGIPDLLVAELGTFFPEDHNKGAVIWLRGLGNGKFSAFWLDGWPRVADVEAADVDGDGKTDLAVAAFGWRKTGQVAILENRTTDPSRPEFVTHTIDPRSGSIHIVPVDLNRDGRMDFITVLAQEHETVLAYINQGHFTFERQVVYAAPHANWGSSGIQVVDLDKDGDLDVILTHGDSFDDGIVKPYHGIQWLENRGGYPFVEHTLAGMPAVHRAIAVDLDGDGDLDIVTCALLAAGADIDESTLPALGWLEQTKPGTFVRHTIEMGFPRHATLDVGDINGDGRPDIVTGQFLLSGIAAGWVDLWIAGRNP